MKHLRRADVAVGFVLLCAALSVDAAARKYILYCWVSPYAMKAAMENSSLPFTTQMVIDVYTYVENGLVAWCLLAVVMTGCYGAAFLGFRRQRNVVGHLAGLGCSLVPGLCLDALLVGPLLWKPT